MKQRFPCHLPNSAGLFFIRWLDLISSEEKVLFNLATESCTMIYIHTDPHICAALFVLPDATCISPERRPTESSGSGFLSVQTEKKYFESFSFPFRRRSFHCRSGQSVLFCASTCTFAHKIHICRGTDQPPKGTGHFSCSPSCSSSSQAASGLSEILNK